MTAQLIQLLGSPDVKVRQRAWTALKGMAESGGAESQMTVQMAGGIERFVSLLKDGSLEAQEYADCPTDDLATWHADAHHGASSLLPRYALWLLYSASDIVSKVSIASAGCANPIIKILRTGNLSLVAQEHAAAVLSGITSDDIPAVISFTDVNKADIVSAGTPARSCPSSKLLSPMTIE